MKIVMVHNTYKQPGGEDIVFEQERKLLANAGHQVITYCRSNHEIEDLSFVDRLLLPTRIIWAKDAELDFRRLLSSETPDVVHVHNTFMMISPSIYSVCSEYGIPVVQTLHNFRLLCPAGTFFRRGQTCERCVTHGLGQSVIHACYRDSRAATSAVALMLAVHRWQHTWTKGIDRFIALNSFCQSKFVEGGIPAEKISIKPNFLWDDPGFNKKAGGEYAVFIGRLSPEKRVLTLLEAWQRLKQPIPLYILGGGPELEFLQEYGKEVKLQTIRFFGQLPRAEALSILRNAAFLLFTSEWYESFPLTIIEAFACGVPVLCSRLGAMEEIISDRRTGLHFTSGDTADLAAKADWAWTHQEEMAELARAARQEFESHYTAETNYPRLMQIYEQTLAEYRPERTDSVFPQMSRAYTR
jgi:glycosyltransferase involved in cell wall biosynthesis